MKVIEMIGKRLLLKVGGEYHVDSLRVAEFRILEVSPSENWVKLMNLHGNKFWRATVDIAFVEELRDLQAEKDKLGGGTE